MVETEGSTVGISPEDFDSDEEKQEFIRGVMMAQVWAKVVDDAEPEDIATLHEESDELAAEWNNLIEGDEHKFGEKVADYYGIPFTYTKNGIKLQHPWAERYEKAWVKLGVEPSFAEKMANAVFFGVMSRE